MKDGLKVIAVVPARGGNNEVPYLNIKKLGSFPLIAHTINEAKLSQYIDRLIVSTDDDQVAQVAREYGAEVPFRRPQALAEDISEIKHVIRHAVETLEKQEGVSFDVIVALQATSPFRTAKQIDAAIEELVEKELDAVISLKEERSLMWHRPNDKLEPLFEQAGRRDELSPIYNEDGAIRVFKRRMLGSAERLGERIGHVLMDKMSALTVHDIYDFWLAEKLVRLPRILFRVDGGEKMGMGHVYRSLAVAEALKSIVSHADVCFLMCAELPTGVRHVSGAGHAVRVVPGSDKVDTDGVIEVIRDYSPNVIVNDLPFLEDRYLRALASLGASTVNLVDSLDDIERPDELASIIVSMMQEGEYELEDYHAGPAFAVLRDSFQKKTQFVDQGITSIKGTRKVVLSFGGSDPQNLTMKALSALSEVPDLSVVVILGVAYGYRRSLEEFVTKAASQTTVLRNVEHMAEIFFDADLVLCSGGMTVFEIAALGRPGVVLCQNTRERDRMDKFSNYGTICHLGLGTEVPEQTIREKVEALFQDFGRRREMGLAGSRLVDANGAKRVYEVIKKAGNKGPAQGGRWQ